VYVFNDITKTAKKITFFGNNGESVKGFDFKRSKTQKKTDIGDEEYQKRVAKIINDIRTGRAMQCVLSRKVEIPLKSTR
jgi:anthranilate/para-aminobenzoate synthase component I